MSTMGAAMAVPATGILFAGCRSPVSRPRSDDAIGTRTANRPVATIDDANQGDRGPGHAGRARPHDDPYSVGGR